MKQNFEQIVSGMTMDEVEAILGPPDKSHPTRFGDGKMTTWAYRADGELLFVWFNENGKVRVKSDN